MAVLQEFHFVFHTFWDLKRQFVAVIRSYVLCIRAGFNTGICLLLDLATGTTVLESMAALKDGLNNAVFPALQFLNVILGMLVGSSIVALPLAQNYIHLNRYCLLRSKIRALPKVRYRSSEEAGNRNINTSCGICLGRIEGEEMVRVLPSCQHCFHMRCIDRWLLYGNNCPVCRATVYDWF